MNIVLKKYTDDYYDFVYEVKKNAYKKYVEECWGNWDDTVQREYFKKFMSVYKDNSYIIEFDGKDVDAMQKEIDDWKKKAEDAEKNFNAKEAEREKQELLKEAFADIEFTSNAAKNAIMACGTLY